MKYILIFLSVFFSFYCLSQSTYPIRADKVIIEKVGGSAELVLKNATRDSLHGILTNTGAGNTAFIRVKILNDSLLVIGLDTIKIKGAYPKPLNDDKQLIDITNEVVVDTSIITSCGYTVSNYTKLVFPSLIGQQRIRPFAIDRIPEDCTFGWFFTWDYITGTLRIYPAYNFLDSSSAAIVYIENY